MKYVFLVGKDEKPIIINSSLTKFEEEKLVKVLKANKDSIGWHISDLKGISPSYYMHNINLEDDCYRNLPHDGMAKENKGGVIEKRK